MKRQTHLVAVLSSMLVLAGFGLAQSQLPTDLSAIVQTVGNPKADTVIVGVQGGPSYQLAEGRFLELLVVYGKVDREKNFLVNVHQAQTLNPQRFANQMLLLEEAKAVNQETTAMLSRVVHYFVARGKKVYVVGYSYGAFVVTNLLATDGPQASGYLILAGRLDMPEEVWASFAKAVPVRFSGELVRPFTETELAGAGGLDSIGRKNTLVLAAGMGYKRFTQLLGNTNLSKVVYGYGQTDEAVGKLSDAELAFLRSRNIKKILTLGGGHSEAINGLIALGLAALMGQ